MNFDPRFFHQTIPFLSLINVLNHFCIFLRIRREIRKYTVSDSAESNFVVEYLREYESIFETSLAHESVDPEVLFYEKTQSSKISWVCLFNVRVSHLLYMSLFSIESVKHRNFLLILHIFAVLIFPWDGSKIWKYKCFMNLLKNVQDFRLKHYLIYQFFTVVLPTTLHLTGRKYCTVQLHVTFSIYRWDYFF
jgi:hypothetical protein